MANDFDPDEKTLADSSFSFLFFFHRIRIVLTHSTCFRLLFYAKNKPRATGLVDPSSDRDF